MKMERRGGRIRSGGRARDATAKKYTADVRTACFHVTCLTLVQPIDRFWISEKRRNGAFQKSRIGSEGAQLVYLSVDKVLPKDTKFSLKSKIKSRIGGRFWAILMTERD